MGAPSHRLAATDDDAFGVFENKEQPNKGVSSNPLTLTEISLLAAAGGTDRPVGRPSATTHGGRRRLRVSGARGCARTPAWESAQLAARNRLRKLKLKLKLRRATRGVDEGHSRKDE